VATAVATTSYLVEPPDASGGSDPPARFVSLFYWSAGNNQLTAALGADEVAVVVIASVVLTRLAVAIFDCSICTDSW
jgi:hypothetical protein